MVWLTVAVMHYCLHLYEAALAVATIANRFAALSVASKAVGFPDPCSNFSIRTSLQGWAVLFHA